LKNNQNLTTSERQLRLQQNQQKLDQIQSIFDSKDTQQPTNNNNFPTGLVVGGVLLAVIGLVSFLIIRKSKNKKEK